MVLLAYHAGYAQDTSRRVKTPVAKAVVKPFVKYNPYAKPAVNKVPGTVQPVAAAQQPVADQLRHIASEL